MVIGLASDAGDTVVQVAPPSVEYSYEVRCDDMQVGAVTYTLSDPLPGTIVEMEGAVSASPPSVMTQLMGALASLMATLLIGESHASNEEAKPSHDEALQQELAAIREELVTLRQLMEKNSRNKIQE